MGTNSQHLWGPRVTHWGDTGGGGRVGVPLIWGHYVGAVGDPVSSGVTQWGMGVPVIWGQALSVLGDGGGCEVSLWFGDVIWALLGTPCPLR